MLVILSIIFDENTKSSKNLFLRQISQVPYYIKFITGIKINHTQS